MVHKVPLFGMLKNILLCMLHSKRGFIRTDPWCKSPFFLYTMHKFLKFLILFLQFRVFGAHQFCLFCSSNRNSPFDKFLKSLAFDQFLCTYIQYKGTVGLFQHLVNLVDSDIAVFSRFPNGKQHFTVDRQDRCLLVLIHHRHK